MKKRFVPSLKLTDNDVTSEPIYHQRRKLIKALGIIGAGALLPNTSQASWWFADDDIPSPTTKPLTFHADNDHPLKTQLTPFSKVTTYNNFYEFGTSKSDPADNAKTLVTDPWSVTISGLVEKPLTISIEQILKQFPLEERIYRMRCVEAWSMVIPWIGFELSALLKQVTPLSAAKYVAFETLYDPQQMPGQNNRFIGGGIDYPYVEGLRLDEAMHPLTIMSVGLYGKTLLPQNGAPLRLVVPWKYGFKSIKSIVRIRLTDTEPPSTWNRLAPSEYGFYANVNPNVDHPRWSQKSERRLTQGGLLGSTRIPTDMFNGYREVTPLYRNLDLTTYF